MSWRKRFNPPLWAQILAIVVGALAAAQVVTLALTVFFPPDPPRKYSIADISTALRGGVAARDRDRQLVLTFETAAPSLQSPGWVVSPPATKDIARLVGVAEGDVRLLFYAPPPLAGGTPTPPPPHADGGPAFFTPGMAPPGMGPPGMPPGGFLSPTELPPRPPSHASRPVRAPPSSPGDGRPPTDQTMPQARFSRSTSPAAVPERTLAPPNVGGGFRLGQAPSVEGEFVAAMKIADRRWATVRPHAKSFLNSWQRRVLLWFGLSVALIAPLALFVAWRLAAPLKVFAEAADRLGREPSADFPPLSGPAEIGKAADAFNLMQQRLKRYVDDRTGMIRAISHDLRTPLTRMRFKLERAPPALRTAMSRDMDQMEEMIASVLSFLRDQTQGAGRQVVDLRSLLEVVVDDAHGPAKLEPGPPVLAEIDVVGVQRVVENLIDNALKYGERATVRLQGRDGEAWIEVADDGPGLSPEDLERVFQPFYRSAAALASGKAGVGLGLSVSRSTIRAHGGDLRLRSEPEGLVAELRLPEARTVRPSVVA